MMPAQVTPELLKEIEKDKSRRELVSRVTGNPAAAFNDPAARALMQRISYVVDPDSTFPRHYTGEVRVTLDDGRVIGHRESVNRGHAERPLSNDEIRDKFFDNATLHFPRAHADAVCDQVLALDRIADVRTLESLLARDPSID